MNSIYFVKSNLVIVFMQSETRKPNTAQSALWVKLYFSTWMKTQKQYENINLIQYKII
jgi:hypothetical protein